jgi:hypothetical protein
MACRSYIYKKSSLQTLFAQNLQLDEVAYDEGTTSPAEQAASTGDRQNPPSCLSLTSRRSRIAVPPPKSPQTRPQAPPPTRDETFQHVESVRHERRAHDTSDSSGLLVALAPPEPYIKRHSLVILSRKRVQTTKTRYHYFVSADTLTADAR